MGLHKTIVHFFCLCYFDKLANHIQLQLRTRNPEHEIALIRDDEQREIIYNMEELCNGDLRILNWTCDKCIHDFNFGWRLKMSDWDNHRNKVNSMMSFVWFILVVKLLMVWTNFVVGNLKYGWNFKWILMLRGNSMAMFGWQTFQRQRKQCIHSTGDMLKPCLQGFHKLVTWHKPRRRISNQLILFTYMNIFNETEHDNIWLQGIFIRFVETVLVRNIP